MVTENNFTLLVQITFKGKKDRFFDNRIDTKLFVDLFIEFLGNSVTQNLGAI